MARRAYIMSRLVQMVGTVAILTVLVFLMLRLVPGDPAITLLGVEATPDKVAALREHMGLNQPLPVQFGLFITNLAQGDLGRSLVAKAPVGDLVRQRLPLTLSLVAYAMALALLITLPLAILSALKRDTWIDQIVRGGAMAVIATPSFWIGILLLIVLGVNLKLFPVGGVGKTPLEQIHFLFLPALTMGLHVSAVLTRNLRDAILTTLNADHVTVARAKGLKQSAILVRHVVRNALVSTVTLFGLYVGWLVGGSVIIESVFALPGMGSMMVTSIFARDYAVVQGFTLVYAVLVSVVYLLTDVAYSFVDPRVSL